LRFEQAPRKFPLDQIPGNHERFKNYCPAQQLEWLIAEEANVTKKD
jgi:hypothetical protein